MTQPTTADLIEFIDWWVDNWLTHGRPDNVEFGKEIRAKLLEHDHLTRWKSEAMQVMNDLDFQEIGKEIDLDLGDNIAKSILPYIKKAKAKLLAAEELEKENAEFERLLKKYMKIKAAADEMAKILEAAIKAMNDVDDGLCIPHCVEQQAEKAITTYREAGK